MYNLEANDSKIQSNKKQQSAPAPNSISEAKLLDYEFSSENPLSARFERPYLSRTLYDTQDEAKENLKVAKAVLPKVESAYSSSGKMPFKAGCGLLVGTPFILLLMLGCSLAVVLGEAYTENALVTGLLSLLGFGSEYADNVYDSDIGWLFAIASIIVSAIVAGIILLMPGWLYAYLSKLLKNRNSRWPAILTLIIAFVTAIVFFWPIWDGFTLAPTEITILFIPIKWVFIVLGGGIIPLFSSFVTASSVGEQKFCEESGVFLKPTQNTNFAFDWTEDVLQLLSIKDYSQLKQVPSPDLASHAARLTLWWHDKAETAYLELTAFFLGKAMVKNKEGKMEEKEVTDNWLIFSERINRVEAEKYLAQLK